MILSTIAQTYSMQSTIANIKLSKRRWARQRTTQYNSGNTGVDRYNLILIVNTSVSGTVAKIKMEAEQYGGQAFRKEDLWTPSAILNSISILFRFRMQSLIELLSVQLCSLLTSRENKNRNILHQESASQMGSCLTLLLGARCFTICGLYRHFSRYKIKQQKSQKYYQNDEGNLQKH